MHPDEELNLSALLPSIALDASIGIELRIWIRGNIGVEPTALKTVRADGMSSLSSQAQAKLIEKLATYTLI
jgi:hypothetical protein